MNNNKNFCRTPIEDPLDIRNIYPDALGDLKSDQNKYSVVEVITENGNRIGTAEDVPENVITIETGLTYEEAFISCHEYCQEHPEIPEYEGDCMFIDYANYKEEGDES